MTAQGSVVDPQPPSNPKGDVRGGTRGRAADPVRGTSIRLVNSHGKRHVRSVPSFPPPSPAAPSSLAERDPPTIDRSQSGSSHSSKTSRTKPPDRAHEPENDRTGHRPSPIITVDRKSFGPEDSPALPFSNKMSNSQDQEVIVDRADPAPRQSVRGGKIGPSTQKTLTVDPTTSIVSIGELQETNHAGTARDEGDVPRTSARSGFGSRVRPVGTVFDISSDEREEDIGRGSIAATTTTTTTTPPDDEQGSGEDSSDEDGYGPASGRGRGGDRSGERSTGSGPDVLRQQTYRSRGLDTWSDSGRTEEAQTHDDDRTADEQEEEEEADDDGDREILQRNRWSAVRYTPGPLPDMSMMDVDLHTGAITPRVRVGAGAREAGNELSGVDEVKRRSTMSAVKSSAGHRLKKKDSGILKVGNRLMGRIKDAFPSSSSSSSPSSGDRIDGRGISSSSLDHLAKVGARGLGLQLDQMSSLERVSSRGDPESGVEHGGDEEVSMLERWTSEGIAVEQPRLPVEMEIPRVVLTPADDDDDATSTPIVLHETYSPKIEEDPTCRSSSPRALASRPKANANTLMLEDHSQASPASRPTSTSHPISGGATSTWSNWSSSTTDMDGELEACGDEACSSPVFLPSEVIAISVTSELEEGDDDLPLGQVVLRRTRQKSGGENLPVIKSSAVLEGGEPMQAEVEIEATVFRTTHTDVEREGQLQPPTSVQARAGNAGDENETPISPSTSSKMKSRENTASTPNPTRDRRDSTKRSGTRSNPPAAPLGMGRPQLMQFNGVKCSFDLPPATFSSRAIQPGARRSIVMPKRKDQVLNDLADKKAERRNTQHQVGRAMAPHTMPQRIPAPKLEESARPEAQVIAPAEAEASRSTDGSPTEARRPPTQTITSDPFKSTIRLIVTKDLPPIGTGTAQTSENGPPNTSRDLPSLPLAIDLHTLHLPATNQQPSEAPPDQRAHRTSLKGMLHSRRGTRPSAMLVSAFPESIREAGKAQDRPDPPSPVNAEVAKWAEDSVKATTADEAKRSHRLTLKRSLPSIGRKNFGMSPGFTVIHAEEGQNATKTITKRFSLASLKDVFKGKAKPGWDTEMVVPPMPALPRGYSKETAGIDSPVLVLTAVGSPQPAYDFDGSGLSRFSDQRSDDFGSIERPRSTTVLPNTPPAKLVPSETSTTDATESSFSMSISDVTASSSLTTGTSSDGELVLGTPIIGTRRASNVQLFTFPPCLPGSHADPTVTANLPAQRPVVVSTPSRDSRPHSMAGMLGLKTGRAKIDEMIESLRSGEAERRESGTETGERVKLGGEIQKLDSMHFNEDGLGIDFGQWTAAMGRADALGSVPPRR